MEELLKAKDVQKLLNCNAAAITRLCDSGRLEFIDLNCGAAKKRQYRFTMAMVENFLKKAKGKPKPAPEVEPIYVSKV